MKFRQAKKIIEGNSNLVKRFRKLRPPYTNEKGCTVYPSWHDTYIICRARKALLYILEHGDEFDNKVYLNAVLKLATSDLRYTGMFITQSHPICFRNHQRDKKKKTHQR